MNKFESEPTANSGMVPTAPANPSPTSLSPQNRAVSAQPKKVYTSPHLTAYGDVKKLTETVGNGAVNDGVHFKTA